MVRLFVLGSVLQGQRLVARWVGAVCAALLMALGGQATAAPMISAYGNNTRAVKSDGTFWAWGASCCYTLFPGGSYVDYGYSYVPVLRGIGFDSVVQGHSNNVALMADGSLWISGNNSAGQLGLGTIGNPYDSSDPLLIGPGFKSASTYVTRVFAIKTDGSLLAWGANYDGILGDGGTTDVSYVSIPKQIGSDYANVTAGEGRTYAVKTNGDLWGWGNEQDVWLGNWPANNPFGAVRGPIFLGSGYASVSLGWNYTLALKTDGSLWGWGYNSYGLLGDDTTTNAFTPKQIGTGFSKVSAGGLHALALKSDGSLWAWGANSYGQLGDGSTADASAPQADWHRIHPCGCRSNPQRSHQSRWQPLGLGAQLGRCARAVFGLSA